MEVERQRYIASADEKGRLFPAPNSELDHRKNSSLEALEILYPL